MSRKRVNLKRVRLGPEPECPRASKDSLPSHEHPPLPSASQGIVDSPSSTLPAEAHEFARLVMSGRMNAVQACRHLGIDQATALAWIRSPSFSELSPSRTTAAADYAVERAADLLGRAFDVKEEILNDEHIAAAVRNRAADSIIGIFGDGFSEFRRRQVVHPSTIEINLLISTLAEVEGEGIIDIDLEDAS